MRCWNGSRRPNTKDLGICFPVPSLQREEAAEPCRGSQKEDPAGFCERRHPRRGLAYLSAHGWDDAGRYGRTSTHDPRLLASQQSPCDEQVSSSNAGEQTFGARQAGGCDLAGRFAVGKQINSRSVVGAEGARSRIRSRECAAGGVLRGLLDPNGPRFFFWVCCK